MKKFFKTFFLLGGTALAGYFGYKAYKKINSIMKLDKSLPEFLNNVYGEKPTLHINQSFGKTAIKVGFNQEIIDKFNDVEATVREYIDDFYPDIAKGNLSIEIIVKGTEPEKEESCCCGEDSDEECCKDKEAEKAEEKE